MERSVTDTQISETVFIKLWLDIQDVAPIDEPVQSDRTEQETDYPDSDFSDTHYNLKLRHNSNTAVVSEKVIVEGLVRYLDERLRLHLDEDLSVEYRSVLHGSLELLLAISATASLTGNILGNTNSLISNIQTLSSTIESLSSEWMWRSGYIAPKIIGSPVSKNRQRPNISQRLSNAVAAPAQVNAVAAPAQVENNSPLFIPVVSAMLAAVVTAVIVVSMISTDISTLETEVGQLTSDMSFLKGQLSSKP